MAFVAYQSLIKNYLHQQIHFNGNIFENQCWRCNEGSLYPENATITKHSLTAFTPKEGEMRNK